MTSEFEVMLEPGIFNLCCLNKSGGIVP
uniref:Uncharacterized protein n=1 Tax=Musa acuminata subsp. malaccensis TaxID=214687 RepID=A0A804LBP7_MUSAM